MLSALWLSLKGSWPEGNIQRTALDTANGFCKVFLARGKWGFAFPWGNCSFCFLGHIRLCTHNPILSQCYFCTKELIPFPHVPSYASCYGQLHLPVVFHSGTIYKVSPLLQTVLNWCHKLSHNRYKVSKQQFPYILRNSYLYK